MGPAESPAWARLVSALASARLRLSSAALSTAPCCLPAFAAPTDSGIAREDSPPVTVTQDSRQRFTGISLAFRFHSPELPFPGFLLHLALADPQPHSDRSRAWEQGQRVAGRYLSVRRSAESEPLVSADRFIWYDEPVRCVRPGIAPAERLAGHAPAHNVRERDVLPGDPCPPCVLCRPAGGRDGCLRWIEAAPWPMNAAWSAVI